MRCEVRAGAGMRGCGFVFGVSSRRKASWSVIWFVPIGEGGYPMQKALCSIQECIMTIVAGDVQVSSKAQTGCREQLQEGSATRQVGGRHF